MSRLHRLLATHTFRLGLVYVALFSLSVVVLFGFIYTFATGYITQQINDSVQLRFEILNKEYKENGTKGVESRISELIASDDEGAEIYLLINKEHEALAGNLNEWPRFAKIEKPYPLTGEWVRFFIEGTRNHPGTIAVQAIRMPLSEWRSLLVGQSMQSLHKVEQTIRQAFWGSLAISVVMALLGAVIMTRSVMQRLALINRSTSEIMKGDITTRIPVRGGGDEFDELAHHLNRLLDRIEALMGSLDLFASNIAHDLRSPLTRLITRTEAGMRGLKDDAPAKALLEQNVDEMQRLIATFNAILNISELEASTREITFSLCDLTDILTQLMEFYEPVAAEKSLKLTATLPALPAILGEERLLTQAFANLLENAIKFTPKAGRIRLYAKAKHDAIEVVLADSGSGIPAQYRERVFDKFFRLEESRSAGGNGLGLSLVAAIFKLHRASITLEDNAPGLKIRLRFPTSQ